MKTTIAELAEHAASSTALPKTVCMTLLQAGWRLELGYGKPTTWVQDWSVENVRGGA